MSPSARLVLRIACFVDVALLLFAADARADDADAARVVDAAGEQPIRRGGAWIAIRPEIAMTPGTPSLYGSGSPTGWGLGRVEVGLGGRRGRFSLHGVVSGGLLFTMSGGNPIGRNLPMAAFDFGIIAAGVAEIPGGELAIGPRLSFDLFGDTVPFPAGTAGLSFGFRSPQTRQGQAFRVAIEPGIVLPFLTPTLAISVGMAFEPRPL